MKNKMSKIAFIILSVVFAFSACMTVFAVTTKSVTANQNGLEATLNFNKQEYKADEKIEATLNVKNNNSYAVKNIQTELIVPSTMKLSKGSLKQEAFSLNAGESKVQEVALEKVVETNNNEPTTNSPQTGDNVVVYFAMMIVSAVALVVIAVKKKWIHKKKVMSLVLCFTLVGAMTLTSVVNAEPTTKEFTVEGTIKVDGEDVVIKGKVTYTHEIYSKLQIDGADKGMYVEGDTVTITAEDAPEGKHFTGWTVVKGNVTLADKNSKTTTFVMGTEEVEIKANYEVNTYTITSTAGANGTITETATVNYGDSKTFTITPNAHYHIEKVLVDGEDKGTINTYTFKDVKESHTIDVIFAIDTFTITSTSNDGGSITGNTTVNYNENTTLNITADEGYAIIDVKVNGDSKGKISSYTFGNVIDNNQKIEVVFGVTTTETFRKAVLKGGTVEVAESFEMGEGSIYLSDVKTVINLNGYSVEVIGSNRHVYVEGNSELTINAGTFEIPIDVKNNGKLVLNGVALDHGLYVTSGTTQLTNCSSDSYFVVDGGSFKANNSVVYSFYVYNTPTLDLENFTIYDKGDMDNWLESSGHQATQTKDSNNKDIWVVTKK